MKTLLALLASAALAAACAPPVVEEHGAPVAASEPHVAGDDQIAAGRYLVLIGGCNDCHTANYAETGGNVPEGERLLGNTYGFRGPWGVSYPANLRLTVAGMSEDAWATSLKTRDGLPPMPWYNLRGMSDQDRRLIYRYIKSLGAKGERLPPATPPGEEPTRPYIYFVPITGKAPR